MSQAIKVGKYRIQLNNISHVSERTSNHLVQFDEKWHEDPYAKQELRQSGLVVTITFAAMGSEEGYEQEIRLYQYEASAFLTAYDRIMEIVEV